MNFMTDLLDDYCFTNYGHKKWKQEFDDKGQEVITFEPMQIKRRKQHELIQRNRTSDTRVI